VHAETIREFIDSEKPRHLKRIIITVYQSGKDKEIIDAMNAAAKRCKLI
jgi:fructoselysine-6-P-deglycase FrlB-like protein